MRVLSLALSLAVLAGCGGGSDTSAYQQAVDAANAQEAQARSLAADDPCQQVSECATVAFLAPTGNCASLSYKAYSLVSSTAAAASAAAAPAANPCQPSPYAGTIFGYCVRGHGHRTAAAGMHCVHVPGSVVGSPCNERPNPSVEGTSNIRLRLLSAAPHVKR